MKLLVFAHVPPPHHGQSYAVKLMLDSFGGDRRRKSTAAPGKFGIECYHVNAQFSRGLEDIGVFQSIKLARLFFHCLEAVWCRFRYGVENFYYVPAPGKRIALYRDWVVMLLCRPFFKRVIFHWHAAGLAKWLETTTSIRTRSFTYNRMRNADLSIVLSDFNRRDAEKLTPRHVAVVSGGIPDPCPDFETEILPHRHARAEALKKMIAGNFHSPDAVEKPIKVLFLAHCTREKGVFDSIAGVMLANEKLQAQKLPVRFKLTLIGAFAAEEEEGELRETILRYGLRDIVEILGFVSPERKARALRESDIFCFPTYYLAENQPGNLIEAMAFGLPVLTTRWRSLPEMLPENYPALVDVKSPAKVADGLIKLAGCDVAAELRGMFLRHFTLEQHLASMSEAFRRME